MSFYLAGGPNLSMWVVRFLFSSIFSFRITFFFFLFLLRLYHAMSSSHFLSHNQCLLARAMASEYFDRQRFASDKRELHLREVLHTLLCPLAQIQSFGCLIHWRFFRQPTTKISASVSTLRVEEVPIDIWLHI